MPTGFVDHVEPAEHRLCAERFGRRGFVVFEQIGDDDTDVILRQRGDHSCADPRAPTVAIALLHRNPVTIAPFGSRLAGLCSALLDRSATVTAEGHRITGHRTVIEAGTAASLFSTA
ncbi:hypothetical protein ACLMAL_21415 [Nocardia sp. CWNU-33]|uniref:hypothetical protein n=1 Tax=Nocardia sp. CWNU-33 TaxID=3392117 RepID=UPI00398F1F8B